MDEADRERGDSGRDHSPTGAILAAALFAGEPARWFLSDLLLPISTSFSYIQYPLHALASTTGIRRND